ncbi:hypothetical protein [Microbulbifer sp. JTAC008]|uniref:hypothetical protein n=1 Tax=unclassified Microbulbifer TaxID=2619833 RepID=UPI00403A6D83
MSKIVKAVNAMVSNQDLIGPVIRGSHGTELFFKYAGKHKWSIIKNMSGDFYLHYYPGKFDLEEMAGWPDEEWHDFSEMVSYNTNELGTKEAHASLSELYTAVQEKLFGMDQVLDDIIADDLF